MMQTNILKRVSALSRYFVTVTPLRERGVAVDCGKPQRDRQFPGRGKQAARTGLTACSAGLTARKWPPPLRGDRADPRYERAPSAIASDRRSGSVCPSTHQVLTTGYCERMSCANRLFCQRRNTNH
jgi:hypothetical protein